MLIFWIPVFHLRMIFVCVLGQIKLLESHEALRYQVRNGSILFTLN